MAKKGSKLPSYHELLNKFGSIQNLPKGKILIDISKFDKLQKDMKRIEVLNLDTVFDQVLRRILCFLCFPRPKDKIVEQLFNPLYNGFLVSLTNKAKLAYALGLIDQTLRSDLEQIHRIRNKFAHNVEADFANKEVIQLVKKLSTAKGKGKQDIENKSYTLYRKAADACAGSLAKALDQELSKRRK